jgi:RNA-directed DNA polymerase
MLEALEKGVKGGKWFRLIDKVWKKENLMVAWEGVKANNGAGGVDRQSVEGFEKNLGNELEKLHEQLQRRTYQPKPVRRTWIDKEGSTEKRPLGIPVVRDRVAQGGLRNVIEPIFDRHFSESSYGFRPWRGAQQAIDKVEELMNQGCCWIVDADIKGYFDNIPQDRLMARVGEKIADGRVLEMIEMFLKAGVMEEGKDWEPTERGTPQGGVISPLLANIYLDPLDHLMEKSGVPMVRYADDFILLCRTEEEAQKALETVRQWMDENGLTLHPEKTRIVNAKEPGGFDFLGYHFEQGRKWVRKKSMTKIKMAVREVTKRTTGDAMQTILTKLNRRLKGWHGYFAKSLPTSFRTVDGFTRRRLRAILLKRRGKSGIGNKKAHTLWPNAYFEKQGLFSLETAHAMKLQSP